MTPATLVLIDSRLKETFVDSEPIKKLVPQKQNDGKKNDVPVYEEIDVILLTALYEFRKNYGVKARKLPQILERYKKAYQELQNSQKKI